MREGLVLLARRELVETLRSRGFRVVTLLLLIGVAVVNALPVLLAGRSDTFDVGLGAEVSEPLQAAAVALGAPLEAEVRTVPIADRADAEARVLDGSLDVALVDGALLVKDPIPANATTTKAQFVRLFEGVARLQLALEARGLSPADAAATLAAPPLRIEPLDPDAVSNEDRTVAGLGSIAVFILVQSSALATGQAVAEEKETRLVEVLLVATAARAILGGKIVGNLVVYAGQAALVATTALVTQAVLAGGDLLGAVGSRTFLAAAGWYLLGFLLYAPLLGAVGSLVSRRQDISSAAFPVYVTLIAGYTLSIVAVEDGNQTLGTVLALIPFTAPTAMPGLLAVGDLSTPVIAASIALSLLAAVGAWLLASWIYQRAVTETGRRVKLRELVGRRRLAAT